MSKVDMKRYDSAICREAEGLTAFLQNRHNRFSGMEIHSIQKVGVNNDEMLLLVVVSYYI